MKNREKRVNNVKTHAESMIDILYDYIDKEMPFQGYLCKDSQKACILQSLNEVRKYIVGINKNDFIIKN